MGVDPIYDSFSPGCVSCKRTDEGRLVRSVFICTFCCSRNHTGAASDGGQRLSGKRQSFDGKETDNRKNINAMQSFGSMDVLCVDKTGTLTQDTVLLEYYMDILGNESQKVLDYAYLASHYSTGVGNHLDEAICKAEKCREKQITTGS